MSINHNHYYHSYDSLSNPFSVLFTDSSSSTTMSTTSTPITSMLSLSQQQIIDLLKQIQIVKNIKSNNKLNTSSFTAQTMINSYYNNGNQTKLTEEELLSRIAGTSLLMNQSLFDSFNQALNGGFSNNTESSVLSSFNDQFSVIDNSYINDNDDVEEIPLSLWVKIVFYAIYLIICLLGICGNLIVCYIVARKSTMHTVTNVFIANLALSDILLCLFAVPFTPLYLITFKNWIFGRALCHLVPFAQGVSVYISAFTLMSIAIDRYFVILHPFKPRMLMKICIMIIIAIWMSAMFLTFPYAHFVDYVETKTSALDDEQLELNDNGEIIDLESDNNDDYVIVYLCAEQWPHEELSKMFGITTTVLQFVIPFLIITFCYVKICAKLADRARTIPGNVSARREEQERERTRKTNGMLISMVVIFVISWLPLNMVNLLADFYEEASRWRNHRAIFLISHAIAMSSTCYNPFLYAWLNENFRKEFKEVLPCFGRGSKSNSSSGGAGGGGGIGTLVELRQKNHSIANDPNTLSIKHNDIVVADSNNCPSVALTMNNTNNNENAQSNKKLMKLSTKDGSKAHCQTISMNHQAKSNHCNRDNSKINDIIDDDEARL